MKSARIIVPVAILFAALVACTKEVIYEPAAIDGIWVFSESRTGDKWRELNISQLFVFDGNGSYVLKTIPSGSDPAYFSDGRISTVESYFSQSGGKVYTIELSGKHYRFGSIQGDFTLVSSGSGFMTFDYAGNGPVNGFKLAKVKEFPGTVEPGIPVEPDGKSLNGTALAEGNDLVGVILDTSSGKGIPGVVVSDGYDCVATDANGVYQFKSCGRTRIVYYSTPAEYQINTGTSKSQPSFYKEVKPTGEVIRTDFFLTPLEGGKETNWTFIGIGDPQCATSSNASRYSSETLPDIKKTMSGRSSVYAMTLGDIVFDSTDMWPTMRSTMSSVYNGTWYIPFFQTIGNHDHDSLKPDTADNDLDDYEATSTFTSFFGPTNYSFNRGDVHVVSMDDIIINSQKSSSKSNGRTWQYDKGFTDAQLNWLRKDLALVPDKDKKMIFICCHIPFRGATSNHYMDVVKLMLDFNEAHLMIGHTHYTQNYVFSSSYKAKGGLTVYEHIHGSACGAWWTSSSSSTVTGEPNGYTYYDIEGAHIADWHFKGTNRAGDFQLRVFDGNDIYYQSKSYPLNWYTASQKAGSGSYTVKGNANLKGCFVAQVFNDDDTYWTVELRRKSTGEKIGSFKRLANKSSTNVACSSYYFNVKNKNSDSYASVTASHYWYFQPSSSTPAGESDWIVVATQKIPGGSVTHEYSCDKITKESDFVKDFYF